MDGAMRRRCPNCKSFAVRRRMPTRLDRRRSLFRSRFRCRDCGSSFSGISRRAYQLLGFLVQVNAAFFALIAALLFAYRI